MTFTQDELQAHIDRLTTQHEEGMSHLKDMQQRVSSTQQLLLKIEGALEILTALTQPQPALPDQPVEAETE